MTTCRTCSQLFIPAFGICEGCGGDGEERLPSAYPLAHWHEEVGDVLWWKFPVMEPPYVGTPLDDDWPHYHTHFTRIVTPKRPATVRIVEQK